MKHFNQVCRDLFFIIIEYIFYSNFKTISHVEPNLKWTFFLITDVLNPSYVEFFLFLIQYSSWTLKQGSNPIVIPQKFLSIILSLTEVNIQGYLDFTV